MASAHGTTRLPPESDRSACPGRSRDRGTRAGAATASAQAAPAVDATHNRPASTGAIDSQAGLRPLTGTVGYVTGPVEGLKPNPLAGTGVDPLDNGVGTQVADFKPLSSKALTGPLAQAPSVGSTPVLGRAAGLLH
ncbi:hypothetical protein SAV31267_060780 [Streptomyces avermitilis]|uniref:Uncharacterized protein n=1 Tax=Streptomyces avermitilis TaxID=33903 RepID=A0A4D4MWT6_STRAX|nr:hypothetical protein SAV31267_060780 [Streptomyces avermitilis]